MASASLCFVDFLVKKVRLEANFRRRQRKRRVYRRCFESGRESDGRHEVASTDNEAVLREAREERERILKEARDMKNKMITEAKEAAATEADKAIVSAKAAIEAEKTAAIAELKNQAASLSIDVAEKILGQELSAENKQTAMIGKIIEDVKFN
jgi:F-type H+-transporting ATPase subunit b